MSKFKKKDQFIKTVNIPNPLFQSLQGRYFVGQTETIHLGEGKNAWGGLVNPCHSNVNLFVNAFTITNHSDQPFTAEIWFNPILPGKIMISDKIAPANTTLSPLPKPKIEIEFAELVEGFPKKGVNVFNRIVPPQSTLTSDEDGKFIFSCGESFIIFLVSPDNEIIESEIAFGWFEKTI
ncbi:hypothetical protein H9I32_09425 [Bacillus sp. Xin]|uniref:DUF6143 family protein n=1 Tax=unclassified Bacillus (in: firmicutes) TaxID=185979 RepID=UPI0015717AC9|nr:MULTISPECIES: DUF6143 family protein [unclassified Bacillus (in: firmicutes)]MBC6972607.1 hypothetical protein [Bacillus sp. Xin]NSW39525.1 hypothetical protein [Bacillus sp. Xin1]